MSSRKLQSLNLELANIILNIKGDVKSIRSLTNLRIQTSAVASKSKTSSGYTGYTGLV